MKSSFWSVGEGVGEGTVQGGENTQQGMAVF